MSTNEIDPLAVVNDLADHPPAQEPLVLQVTETKVVPTPDSSDVPYVSPYVDIKDQAIVNAHLTQMLPNVYVTAEDMDNDISQLEQKLKTKNATKGSIPSKEETDRINDAIAIYTNINYGFFENNEYNAALNTSPNTFVQYLVGEKGKNVRIGYPSFKIKDDVENLEGVNAMRHIWKLTAVGNVTGIPLWHSGIKLTLNVFKEQELLDLNIKLARQRVIIGNNTRGASFTGDDVYTVNIIVDFILDHVIDCNLKGNITTVKLKKLILVTDIPALLCGALADIYPGGYPVAHSCINTMNNTCDYNISPKRKEDGDYEPESLLDFTKLLWVDRAKVGPWARNFMSDDTKKYTNEEILAYQEKLYENSDQALGKSIHQKDTVTISTVFKVPTIAEYNNTCNNWVSRIMTMVDNAIALDTDLGKEERKEKRGKLLNSYAYTLDLLKYENWIDYFKVGDGGITRTITATDDIKESLEAFSGIDKFKENFEKAVQEYKEETILAFTGLPNFECPNCGAGQVEPNSKHPTLIPINMVGYFFITMVRRGMIRQLMG